MADIKQTFILRAVQQYITDCQTTMKEVIRRQKIGVTDDLINSFHGTARTSGAGAVGELLFKEYGRMVDMGAGRGHPLGGLAATKVALKSRQYEGLALIKDKVRKPKKFYSPIVYGKLNYLQNRLLYGYTQETIAMLKKEME